VQRSWVSGGAVLPFEAEQAESPMDVLDVPSCPRAVPVGLA